MATLSIMTSCLMLAHLIYGLPSARRPFSGQTSAKEDLISTPSTTEAQEESSLALKQLRFTNGRVAIGQREPSQPPKFFRNTDDTGFPFEIQSNSTDRISKRSLNHPAGSNSPDPSSSLVPACESVSRWVRLTEAEDLWGSRVAVLQQFDNGRGERVDQYFYETYCSRTSSANPPSCTGTDRANFDSYCLEKHVWAYGKIYDQQQRQERWTFIKIRASCNCGVSRKGFRRNRRASPNMYLLSK